MLPSCYDETAPMEFRLYQVCQVPCKSAQLCILPGSPNRVPALIGWVKGGNVISAWWQVTLRDPTWYVSTRSREALIVANCYSPFTYLLYLPS